MISCLLCSPAMANDAPYEALGGAGQVELTTEADVYIAEEQLEIERSSDVRYDFHVRVTYRFRNPTDAPKAIQLAFPMADAPLRRLHHYDRRAPEMTLTIDGTPYAAGRWVMTLLDAGKPLPTAVEASSLVDPAGRWDFSRICAAMHEGKPTLDCTDSLSPSWEGVSFRAIYTWEHTFAPGDTTVVHDYLVNGAHAESADDEPGWDEAQKACAPVAYRSDQLALTYVVTTASRWARPIGMFELEVRAQAPTTVDSCWWRSSPPRAPGPYSWHVHRPEFVPKEELTLLFSVPMPDKVLEPTVSFGPSEAPCDFARVLGDTLEGRPLDDVDLRCTDAGCKAAGTVWSADALRLLRNATFARHGRPFGGRDLTTFFYRGGAEQIRAARGAECVDTDTPFPALAVDRGYSNAVLSDVDRANVAVIRPYE